MKRPAGFELRGYHSGDWSYRPNSRCISEPSRPLSASGRADEVRVGTGRGGTEDGRLRRLSALQSPFPAAIEQLCAEIVPGPVASRSIPSSPFHLYAFPASCPMIPDNVQLAKFESKLIWNRTAPLTAAALLTKRPPTNRQRPSPGALFRAKYPVTAS